MEYKVQEYQQITDEQLNKAVQEIAKFLKDDITNEDIARAVGRKLERKRKEAEGLQREITLLEEAYDFITKQDPKGNIFTCTRP